MKTLQVSPAGEYHVIHPQTKEVVGKAVSQVAAYKLGRKLERQGIVGYGWWVNCPKG